MRLPCMAYSIQYGGIGMDYVGHRKINFVIKNDQTNSSYIFPEKGEILNYGYGKVSRENSTASINKVNEKEMGRDVLPSIYKMLTRVPGVHISSNGQITIRGLSSIKAQGGPLFVVDGSVITDLGAINPRNVKSISVLKGSAAAMYGSRGSMGVIVIKLKDGR